MFFSAPVDPPKPQASSVLGYRDAEHLGGGLAVDIPTLPKQVEPPCLASKPCDHPGFDGTEVSDDEATALAGDEGCADQLAEGVW